MEEPELLKQFTSNGIEVYDKEKNLDKRSEPEPMAPAGARPGHVLPKRAQGR